MEVLCDTSGTVAGSLDSRDRDGFAEFVKTKLDELRITLLTEYFRQIAGTCRTAASDSLESTYSSQVQDLQRVADHCRCGLAFASGHNYCGGCGERRYQNSRGPVEDSSCSCGIPFTDDSSSCISCGEHDTRFDAKSHFLLREAMVSSGIGVGQESSEHSHDHRTMLGVPESSKMTPRSSRRGSTRPTLATIVERTKLSPIGSPLGSRDNTEPPTPMRMSMATSLQLPGGSMDTTQLGDSLCKQPPTRTSLQLPQRSTDCTEMPQDNPEAAQSHCRHHVLRLATSPNLHMPDDAEAGESMVKQSSVRSVRSLMGAGARFSQSSAYTDSGLNVRNRSSHNTLMGRSVHQGSMDNEEAESVYTRSSVMSTRSLMGTPLNRGRSSQCSLNTEYAASSVGNRSSVRTLFGKSSRSPTASSMDDGEPAGHDKLPGSVKADTDDREATQKSWESTGSLLSASPSNNDDKDDEAPSNSYSMKLINTQGCSSDGVVKLQLLPAWERYVKSASESSLRPGTVSFSVYGGGTLMHLTTEDHLKADYESMWQCLVIRPTDMLRYVWDLASLLCMIHDVITIPLLFFELQDVQALQILSWITRIFWTIDLPMNFLSAFTRSDGDDELRIWEIARKYASTWLFVDLSTVLVDWVTLFVFSSDGSFMWIRVVRAVKMIRLLRLVRASAKVEKFFENIKSETYILCARTFCQMVVFLMVPHVLGCGWFGLGSALNNGWVSDVYDELGDKDKAVLYAMSYHWALTNFASAMETYPKNLAERIYAVSVLVFAFFLSVMLVSSLTSSMTQLQFIRGKQSAEAAALRRFLLETGISHHLKTRVQANASFNVSKRKKVLGESDVELLGHVSPALITELHCEMHFPVIGSHPLFAMLGDVCPMAARQICHTATSKMSVSRGDLLFSHGESPAVAKMIFVCCGELRYTRGEPNQGGTVSLETVVPSWFESWSMRATNGTRSGGGRKAAVGVEREVVHKGQWCCEPVLWLDWTFEGMLAAGTESDLLLVDSKEVRNVVYKFKVLSLFIGPYAQNYLEYVNQCVIVGDLSHGNEASLLPQQPAAKPPDRPSESFPLQGFMSRASFPGWLSGKSGTSSRDSFSSPWGRQRTP